MTTKFAKEEKCFNCNKEVKEGYIYDVFPMDRMSRIYVCKDCRKSEQTQSCEKETK